MPKAYYFDVHAPEAGMRLDRLIRKLLPDDSLSNIHQMIRTGVIQVGTRREANNYRLCEGDVIVLPRPPAIRRTKAPPPETRDWTAPKPKIITENEDWVAIWKPGGLSVQGGTGQGPWSVVNWLKNQYPDAEFPPAPVHRIDLDTTGLLIAAKSPQAARWFQLHLSSRTMRKYYLALVENRPREEHFFIDGPLFRATSGRIKMAIDPRGVDALTEVWTLSTSPKASLVMAFPHTGRTHQIRAHLAHIGCPILMDERYGSTQRLPEDLRLFERIYLHAWRLDFAVPDGADEPGKELRKQVEAPPDDIFMKAIKHTGNRLPEVPWGLGTKKRLSA